LWFHVRCWLWQHPPAPPKGRRKPFGWQTKANANAKANYLVEKEVSNSVCKVKVSYDTLQISQFEFL
jgi:hypothetical protein